MGVERIGYSVVMLAAGLGIPVLAALNARLGLVLGSAVAAAAVMFAVALGLTLAVLWAGDDPGRLRMLPYAPPHLYLAGALIAFYVLSITWVAPRFGVGNAIFCVLLGQMIAATVIGQFGLFGAMQTPLNGWRCLGLGSMAVGLFLMQLR